MVDNNRKWDLEPESVTEIARNLEDSPVGNFSLRSRGFQPGGEGRERSGALGVGCGLEERPLSACDFERSDRRVLEGVRKGERGSPEWARTGLRRLDLSGRFLRIRSSRISSSS